MAEDFVFSSIVLKNVKSYVTNLNAKYYYVDNPNSQTKKRENVTMKKSLQDMKISFDFVECFLKNTKMDEKFLDKFFEWKDLYHRIWKNNLIDAGISEEKSEEMISDNWEDYPLRKRQYVDDYYYEVAEIIHE